MDSLDMHRGQGADKRWQPEETPTIHGDHMGEAWEDIPAEIVKKRFLKTGISNQQHGYGWD